MGNITDRGTKMHFLSCAYVDGGKATIFENIYLVIGGHDDIHTSWVLVQVQPTELIAGLPPILFNESFVNSTVADLRL